MGNDLEKVLIPEDELQAKIKELAGRIDADYAGKELLLVGVLKGAVMVMADLARALHVPVQMDWMAVSSYGAGTKSSGVVRMLKDLDTDIMGRHVLIVEDIIDSGLTLSLADGATSSRAIRPRWRSAPLLRKPDAIKVPIDVKYVGFDIPNEFVDRLRARLCRAVPQPAVHRDPRAARIRRLEIFAARGTPHALTYVGRARPV